MEQFKNIRVVVRVRPLNQRELEQNQQQIIRVIDKRNLIFDPEIDEDEFFFRGSKTSHRDITKRINKKLQMQFDDVFDEGSRNIDVFESCMKPLIASVMDGYNSTVFVYGATGAGKTHTMLGSDENPGITFLAMQELFLKIDEFADNRKFDIGISYLEVYNEQVMNLLTNTGPLMLREDSNGVVVKGLCLKPIYNAEELLNLLALGNRNRTQHPTDANAESSRSHAVFQVHIRMIDKNTQQRRTVKLSMIDLAGSERAASTKCMGIRFKEGASINKSLLALGNCINKLADGLKHIPYRDSNLTRILKDSLGGNCQTVMIANVSQSSLTYEDTYNTLKYASRAKNIRTTLKQCVLRSNMPKEFFLKKLGDQQKENIQLKQMIEQLEAKAAQNDGTTKIIVIGAEGPEYENWCIKIDAIYETAIKAQEHFFSIQSKEKVLRFKSKLKENAEASKLILLLDGSNVCGDIAKFEASIDRYGKLVTRQRDDLIRLRKRYSEATQNIKNLNLEITESNIKSILKLYIKKKETELEAAKTKLNALHIMKINAIYHNELEHWHKTVDLSCDIIQQNYLLLRSSGRIDILIREKLDRLLKMLQGQRAVKFDDQLNETDLTHFHKAILLNDYDDDKK